ncbi:UPF0728 protein C10orf53 homolog isoform X1 [Trichoplusia ni]|uniref:UPF0728 protein C10orf53 homolog isoform X1 n=1 Tax=Trichoplusia ni TaxID=7111 RepID=A0A7E5VMX3_TRINI|nr:UPF0728 protein C10orf53 homolog isoform X1 [Trichoplusia ni]
MSVMYIKAFYGPSTSFHSSHIHKPQFLTGLKIELQRLGYRVDLVPVDCHNYCMLELNGHQVFRCNIQSFHFNTSIRRDPICQRAVNAVQNASQRMMSARDYLYFLSLIENDILTRTEYNYKEYFLSDMKCDCECCYM